MINSNYFQDNPDLQLTYNELIDWQEIVNAYEQGFVDAAKYKDTGAEEYSMAPTTVEEAKDYYTSVLDSLGELMGTMVSQKSQEMDHEGLKYKDGKVTFPKAQEECYSALRDAGLMPMAISRKYRGLGLPVVIQALACDIAARADAAFCLAYGNINIVEIMERFADEEMCQKWLPAIADGKYSAAMALTEPNYGSDLPSVQTKAVQGDDGVWRLTGTKRFITHACGYIDAPSVILTLARTGSPTSGARGLSFFLVQGKDVHVANIEKKMGLHCSPTCEVVFEDAPGELIGKTGYGLVKYSMGMMNAARLTIAAQSLGIANGAYFEAKKYASERIQFGKPIEQIPAVRKMLDKMEREIVASRALVVEAARSIDLYHWRKEHLQKEEGKSEKEINKDETLRFWEKMADLLTPLSKYYASEGCIDVADDAIQIHGGAGYTEEYDVARIYRDSRITTIYEGTTQLQTVAAIGGVVAGMSPTGVLRNYIDGEMGRIQPSEDLQRLQGSLEEVVQLYRSLKGPKKDELAFEVVETAARLVCGILLERSLSKLDGEAKEKRKEMIEAYHLDSLAMVEGNRIRLERAASREPAAV
ncbi:MAG: acyl-CoA dehydrogenase family protein [Leptospiraceae bacterium]|nr:acyl-CoA dehydrogenase family protein [Leptospiraceae bacterium]MCB1302685.1 acyl-CoA dehydrogenase family protein [Leptospiraceae bacterium]